MPRRIVIIGNGVAGITAALELRARDDGAEITVVSDESDYFIARTALMYALMEKLPRKGLEPYERHVYDRQRIARVRGRCVDLSHTERTITLADGKTLAWDALVIATGARPRILELPGISQGESLKTGVVHFVSMSDLDACEALVPSTKRAVVVGGGLIGVELVESLLHHGIATTFVAREKWYWPAGLCREEGELVAAHIRKRGVDLRLDTTVASAKTDANGRVSSVALSTGEAVPCELFGVAIGVEPNVEWLSRCKSAPTIDRGIVVDDRLRTSVEGVWAIGDCAVVRSANRSVYEPIWYTAKRHGSFVARQLTGSSERYEPPVFVNSAKFFELEYTTVGDAFASGARSLFLSHPSREITVRLIEREGALSAFNAIGSRWDTTVIARWIEEKRPMDWVRSRLRDAQFDVEFGRAPIERMTERELEARP
ncbi:MAG: FAD-dependent oxidoreductase [Myxococcales bacterium]|nr:FAD-dependent oxidoreductase [Myxococcales bacterium]